MLMIKLWWIFAVTVSSIYGNAIDILEHSELILSSGINNTGFWLNDGNGYSAYAMSEVYVSGPISYAISTMSSYSYALLTENDVTALGTPLHEVNWANYFSFVDPVDASVVTTFTGEEFYGYKYLVFINWEDRNSSLSDVFFELQPIQFNFIVYQCVDNNFEISLASTLYGVKPMFGNVTIIGTNSNECSKNIATDLSVSNEYETETLTFDKSVCQIEYDSSFRVVYSYNWLVTELNTQIFNVECRQDFTSLVLDANVDNIDILVDEIQQIFDHALTSQMLILSDPTDPTSVVVNEELGAQVSLYISLPSTFRYDFDITVIDCYVDGELVLQNGVSQTSLFSAFDETLKGVSFNQFYLFKSLDHLQSRDILFSCMVETCVDDCSISNSSRRRRSIINKNEEDNKGLVPKHLTSRVQRRIQISSYDISF